MPWEHCGESVLDTDACPACGLTKAEWTVQVDKTRTFVVRRTGRKQKQRDAWIEVQLVDVAGAPVAGAAYRVALPDSRVKKGELDAEGLVRLEELQGGTCDVSFPDHRPEGEERETGARHVFESPKLGQFLFSF